MSRLPLLNVLGSYQQRIFTLAFNCVIIKIFTVVKNYKAGKIKAMNAAKKNKSKETAKVLAQDKVNLKFSTACSKGDLKKVRYYLVSDELDVKAQVNFLNNNALITACSKGNLSLVKYLTSSDELNIKASVMDNDNLLLRSACESGSKEVLEYLFLIMQKEGVDVEVQKCYCLNFVAATNRVDMFDFLIKELGPNSQKVIREKVNQWILHTCQYNAKDIFRYLISNKQTREYINFKEDSHRAFKYAFYLKDQSIIKSFIFDVGIKYNQDIKNFLLNQAEKQNHADKEVGFYGVRAEQMINIFKSIEEKNKLAQKLQNLNKKKKLNSKAFKI